LLAVGTAGFPISRPTRTSSISSAPDLQCTGLADYAGTPGNRGVFVFRRAEGDATYFLITTLWDSLDAIKRFAGEDYERARATILKTTRFSLSKSPR